MTVTGGASTTRTTALPFVARVTWPVGVDANGSADSNDADVAGSGGAGRSDGVEVAGRLDEAEAEMGAAMVTRNSIMISINLMRHRHTPSSPACTAEDLAPGSTHHLFFWASPAMYGSRYTAKRSLCQVGLAAATSSHDSLM